MRSILAIWTLVGLCVVNSSAQAQNKVDPGKPAAKNGDAQPPVYTLYEFRLRAIQESMLSAMKPGVIMELPVKEGASVEKGDVLGQIDDRESQASIRAAKAEIAVAQKQAESDAPIKAAVATRDVAEAEVKKSLVINEARPNTVNDIEVKRQQLTKDKADFQIIVAQQEYEVAQLNVGVKEAQHELALLDAELRKVRAPYSGEVVEMKHHIGEWVQAGEPVLRLVQMDHLRVQGFLYLVENAVDGKISSEKETEQETDSANSLYGNSQPPIDPNEILGRECEVIVQLPKGRKASFKSKIGFVSPVQSTGGKIIAWVEIENRKENGRWLAQPGQMATVKVRLDSKPAAARNK